VRFEIGIANPARGDGGVASTKTERAAIMKVAERYILSVVNLARSPGSERLGWMSYDIYTGMAKICLRRLEAKVMVRPRRSQRYRKSTTVM